MIWTTSRKNTYKLGTKQSSMTEFFGENAWRLLAINYFFKNSIVDV